MDPTYEVELTGANGPTHKIHVFHGGRRIATGEFSGTGLPTDIGTYLSWQYDYPDFVGSNSVVVRSATNPNDPTGPPLITTQASFFTPFGEFTQDGSGLSPYLFTDQEQDPESGLQYFHARYYDPLVGRFLSQDPELVGPAAGATFNALTSDPRQNNAYTYVMNSPTRFSDPTGRCAPDCRAPGRTFPFGLPFDVRTEAGNNIPKSFSEGSSADSTNVDPSLDDVIGPPSEPTIQDFLIGAFRAGGFHGALMAFRGFRESQGAYAESIGLQSGVVNLGLVAGPAGVANAGGFIRSFVTEGDSLFFRVFSGDATIGRFVTAIAPKSSAFARQSLSLPIGNKAEFIQEVLVPAGTRLQRSRALAAFGQRGGSEQFEILGTLPPESFGPGKPLP